MKTPSTLVAPLLGAVLGSLLITACGAEPEDGASPTAADPGEEIAPAEPAPRLRAGGLLPGMKRHRSVDAQPDVTPTCSSPKLSYFGGPLLQSPVIVAVFWNSSVNATLQQGIGQFYADVTQSSYWTWLQEYDTVGVSQGLNQAILPGTYAGSFVITPSKCATSSACSITDAQLQAELTRQIGLGVLPAPVLDCTGNVETIYMVDFPPNLTLSGPAGSGKSCANTNGFCAYHNTGTYTSGTPLVYAALMDQFTGPCSQGCGGDATPLENSTDTASHELVEAVTDPDIGLDTQGGYAAPAAWGDNGNQCGEIADICDSGAAGDTITVSGRTWVVQELWSNKQGKCTSTGTALAVCSGTTKTGCRLCSCGDDGGACNGGTSACETTSSNVDFGACEQCTASSNTCGGATCAQSSTASQDDICSCAPMTTCPAGDDCGTVPNGCGGTISCGTCTAPQTCGGGSPGKANVCGGSGVCTPITACPAGDDCGTVPNGCGGTIDCGTCTAPQTCGAGSPGKANVCGSSGVCTPLTACPAGDDCGTVPNGCGGTIHCGFCLTPKTCGGGTPGKANVCGCAPTTTACPAGDECGTVPDGCGGTVDCGTCGAGEVCSDNQCGSSGTSSTGSSGATSSGATTSSSASSGATSSGVGVGGSSGEGSSGEGGGSGGPGQASGCGCKTVGDPIGGSGTPLSALGLLALAGAARSRRRRR